MLKKNTNYFNFLTILVVVFLFICSCATNYQKKLEFRDKIKLKAYLNMNKSNVEKVLFGNNISLATSFSVRKNVFKELLDIFNKSDINDYDLVFYPIINKCNFNREPDTTRVWKFIGESFEYYVKYNCEIVCQLKIYDTRNNLITEIEEKVVGRGEKEVGYVSEYSEYWQKKMHRKNSHLSDYTKETLRYKCWDDAMKKLIPSLINIIFHDEQIRNYETLVNMHKTNNENLVNEAKVENQYSYKINYSKLKELNLLIKNIKINRNIPLQSDKIHNLNKEIKDFQYELNSNSVLIDNYDIVVNPTIQKITTDLINDKYGENKGKVTRSKLLGLITTVPFEGWKAYYGFYNTNMYISCDIHDNLGNRIDTVSIKISRAINGFSNSYDNNYKEKAKIDAINHNAEKLIKEFCEKIIGRINNNYQIRKYLEYHYELVNSKEKEKSKEFLVWNGYASHLDNSFEENPFKKIQQQIAVLTNNFLKPRNPISISSKIPPKIEKPKLPPQPKLVKSQFETDAMFKKKVKEAIGKRQLRINYLQEKYRKDVEKRNRKVEELKLLYTDDVQKIENEQKQKEEILTNKILQFTRKAFFEIMGNPIFENSVYNAEKQIMYVDLKATNANYKKRISVNIPLEIAESVHNGINKGIKSIYPIVTYSIDKNNIRLERIRLCYREYAYLANLTDEDYKPEKIEVALEDKKIDFDSEEQKQLELQNPNLNDPYIVSAINYGESSSAKGLSYNDDLTPLVKSLKSKQKDPSKWLFLIAIEDYDETDPVEFAENSGKLFKNTAQKVFGIKQRNTYDLINEKATSGAIKDKLQLLLDNVKSGDAIYFYFSGHGVPDPKSGEPYILPKDKVVDFISKEQEFRLSNIYKKLSNSKATKIFVFIDACFSGKTDNIPLFKGVAPGLLRTKEIKYDDKKMVIITAGKNNQFSNSFDDRGHRLFSYYLIKNLVNRDDSNINLLYKDLSVKVYDISFEKGDTYIQEPQIYGNSNLNLFGD